MILADKIIMLRKKNGLSQEELAEKLGVSRQSVSKWEGAQSVPDLNKILAMTEVFNVTTDFLLKDELETPEYTNGSKSEDVPPIRHVSMEDANAFLSIKEKNSFIMAIATFLCILAPVFLIGAGGLCELAGSENAEGLFVGIGLIAMLITVTIAVVLFIQCGNRTEPYSYLEKEPIETDYGVSGMVKDRKAKFKPTYNKKNLIGTVTCILSTIPFFAGLFFESMPSGGLFMIGGLCIMMIVAGVGVTFFVSAGVIQSSMEQLLQEGDFTKSKKTTSSITSAITTIFWLLAVAVYLIWSFVADSWQVSWIVFAVAGVLYPAVLILCKTITGEK